MSVLAVPMLLRVFVMVVPLSYVILLEMSSMFASKLLIYTMKTLTPAKKFYPSDVTFPLIMSSTIIEMEHKESSNPSLNPEALVNPIAVVMITRRRQTIKVIDGQRSSH